ncbi:cytochrome d ubiquinol oxidase subunit II [Mucilaginibacter sp. SD-g]|uniref:Cytochrome d ubiquinol oxidase subunit II n=2 Tax=Mucilaginibacter segetis TaxID=2793071 RepID=A0A934PTI4_9SPHI|nr:cytochrome d ubiquinol oxidase subunit II [Mucilaginibacter segetis]MBK0378718.1 cytochrome d ubiquinol oxidase subunit II [Mucilaginibacter segetis]
MLYIVIGFLWVSMLIYVLMGGADFGAGILELFTSENNRSKIRTTTYNAMGPIWEANHMWLIIAVVILFVGFPGIYTTVSVYMHIPLVIMLMGIIARGTAFTFRHYDAVKDNMQQLYNRIYVYSSFITPLFLGVIAGSAVSRQIDTDASTFASAYILGWFNWFSFSVGFFTVAICGFLAAVYLIGDVKDLTDKKRYIRKAKMMNGAMAFWIIMIFWFSYKGDIPLFNWLFGNFISVATTVTGLLSLILLWIAIYRNNIKRMRFYAGFMTMMLLIAVTYSHYPNIILLKNGAHLSLFGTKGPDKTINSLGIALLAGSLFIVPSLVYLIYSTPKKTDREVQ